MVRGLTCQQEVMREILLEQSRKLIDDELMQSFVEIVYRKDFVNPLFFEDPCSGTSKNHPPENNGFGGIARHTVKAGHVASSLSDYFGLNPLYKNCAVASTLVHDIHKFGHPSWGTRTARGHGPSAASALEDLAKELRFTNKVKKMILDGVKYHMWQWMPNPEEAIKPLRINPSSKGQTNPRIVPFVVQLSDYLSSRKNASFYSNARIDGWPQKDYKEMLPELKRTISDLKIVDEKIVNDLKQSFVLQSDYHINLEKMLSPSNYTDNFFGEKDATQIPVELRGSGGVSRLAIKTGYLADDLLRFFNLKPRFCDDCGKQISGYSCPECETGFVEKNTLFCQETLAESMKCSFLSNNSYSGFNPGITSPLIGKETSEEGIGEIPEEGMLVKIGSQNPKTGYLIGRLAGHVSRKFSFYPEARVTGYLGEAMQAVKEYTQQ
ncbi:MAG: HD domain-containing protein [Nanoarchaeota archaeon]|nr:HD domain-containing protein [Nanoarchaeota archaeon]